MSLPRRILLGLSGWLVAVTVLHLWLNTRFFDAGAGQETATGGVRFRVGFLPVT